MGWKDALAEITAKLLYWVIMFAVCWIPVHLIVRLFRRRPCWLCGHRKDYVSLYRGWWAGGRCLRPRHDLHLGLSNGDTKVLPTWIGRWVCTKCTECGTDCFGLISQGSYKIEHGRVVSDPKGWANYENPEVVVPPEKRAPIEREEP